MRKKKGQPKLSFEKSDIKLTLELAALHFDKLTVTDELNTVVLKILVSIRVFHELIFPDSVLPSGGDTLKLIALNRGMNEGFRYAVLGDIRPDLENGFSVFLIALTHCVIPIGEEKIIGDNKIIILAPSL